MRTARWLSIAVLAERTDQPKVKLAIKGRSSDGWCPLGEIRVAP